MTVSGRPHLARRQQSITTHACGRCHLRRRQALAGFALALCVLPRADTAKANVLDNLARGITRPEGIDQVSATVDLMDAASVLQEVQALANTPTDSPDRFRSRALLPGMAGRLRAVGPSVAALLPVLGETDDKALSARYGGEATTESPAEDVYRAIGRAITISGRTLRPETLEERSQVATDAQKTILAFLDLLPEQLREDAQAVRIQRNAIAAK